MLSIEVCRKILGKDKTDMPDEKIEEIRETLYQISKILVNNYFEVKNK